MILGISGKQQSGKSLVAELIAKHSPSKRVFCFNFADKLKEVVECLTHIRREVIKTQFENVVLDFSIEQKSCFIPEFNLTVRELLQRIGTEVFRRYDKDFWVKALERELRGVPLSEPNVIVVIPDVRFLNEAAWVKKLGGKLIRVNRNSNLSDNHPSETDLDLFEGFDLIIDNNSTMESLELKVQEFIRNHISILIT